MKFNSYCRQIFAGSVFLVFCFSLAGYSVAYGDNLSEWKKESQRIREKQDELIVCLIILARVCEKKGDIESAIKYYQRLSKILKHDIDVLEKLGDCYIRHGKMDEAYDIYQKAHRACGRDDYRKERIAQKGLEVLLKSDYEKDGSYQKAIERYKTFLADYSETKQQDCIRFKIGLLYKKLGKIDKAKEFYHGLTWDEDSVWADNARMELWLSTGEGEPKKKAIYAVKVSTPPLIDGLLTDPVWKKADKVTGFVDSFKNIPVSQQTIACLIYDKNNLYIAFNCLESNISSLVAKANTHDVNVWNDDCIEVFLDTNRDYSTYFQLIANVIGTQRDGRGKNKAIWNPKWKVAAAIGDTHWNVEIAIPFKELDVSTPEPGQVWGLNLNRARRAGEREISGWTFMDKNHHQPERFGYLIFK